MTAEIIVVSKKGQIMALMRILTTAALVVGVCAAAYSISMSRKLAALRNEVDLLRRVTPPSNSNDRQISGSNPKEVVLASLERATDITADFVRKNYPEIISTLQIATFAESDGVGVAYYQFKVGSREFYSASCLRKEGNTWYLLSYLPYHGHPFLKDWVQTHRIWLNQQDANIRVWTEQSADMWLGDSPSDSVNLAASKRNQCIDNLKCIDGGMQQWALENKKGSDAKVTSKDVEKYLKYGVFPKCPSGGTYSISTVKTAPICSKSAEGHSIN